MGEPTKLAADFVHRDITPGRPRAWHCSDCERDLDRAEQCGMERPAPKPIREASRNGGIWYQSALCAAHSNLEHCRVFQRAREQHLGDHARLTELDGRHEDKLRAAGQTCVCARALERSLRIKAHDAKWLHPCASGCGRRLVDGVARCWECKQKLVGTERTEAAQ